MSREALVLGLCGVLVATASACGSPSAGTGSPAPDHHTPSARESRPAAREAAPRRFRIVPDDYHVPYAGTAEDGRRFFLSQELFGLGTADRPGSAYVGLFLWKADGTFDEVRVDPVGRPAGVPAGQAAPAGADDLVAARLAELGEYVLEPVEVEPFLEKVDGVSFGWKVGWYDDGTCYLNIEPGNFIAYYAPWDGLDYDT